MSSDSYLHQLESLALLPPCIRAILPESEKLWGEHRWLAILVVSIIPYVEMIIQPARNTLDLSDNGFTSELQATSVSRLYASWIPVIEQNQGAVLELNATGLLAVWGIPTSEDFLIKAINTA
jgi:hypothetical protein